MNQKTLETLNERLKERSIPARLIEDGRILTVLLSPPVTPFDIYGDIYYADYPADEVPDGLLVQEWEVQDITALPDAVHAAVSTRAAVLNADLPAGGYGIRVAEDGSDQVMLVYRMVLPVGQTGEETWREDELMETVETAAAVLGATAELLMTEEK
ncbi:MAG: hypothetical protein IJT34_06950 [Butyrivibrio sp.]|nr:hypothetical protein [Butyrivibrio sp.]